MRKLLVMMMATLVLLLLCACGGTASDNDAAPAADLNAVYETMADVLPDMLIMDADSMMNFYGVDAALCEQYVMAICADGLRADEVWLMQAKDEKALDELKNMAESRLTAKEDETIDYVPEQYEIVKEAELYTDGLYLVFLVSPEVDNLKTVVDSAIQ